MPPWVLGVGEEGCEPLGVVVGWAEHARPGVQGGAERVRLLSPGALCCGAVRAGSSQWGLFCAPGQAAGIAPELSVMSLPHGWTETYDFWWLDHLLPLVLPGYLSHLSLWRGRDIAYTVQNRERNKARSTEGPEPCPLR